MGRLPSEKFPLVTDRRFDPRFPHRPLEQEIGTVFGCKVFIKIEGGISTGQHERAMRAMVSILNNGTSQVANIKKGETQK